MNEDLPEDRGSASSLRILFVDDNAADIGLEWRQLEDEGLVFEWRAVSDRAGLEAQVDEFKPHVILCDYSIPGFSGREALKVVRERVPGTPFIFISGTIGEERAVECLREGAADYVLKDNPRRLGRPCAAPLPTRASAPRTKPRSAMSPISTPLTGLPNRTLLRDRLEQAIVHASRTRTRVAAVVLDLDGFHRLNEALGPDPATRSCEGSPAPRDRR
jgi:PleD family two-component response regulator